jgi:hypothetical protein
MKLGILRGCCKLHSAPTCRGFRPAEQKGSDPCLGTNRSRRSCIFQHHDSRSRKSMIHYGSRSNSSRSLRPCMIVIPRCLLVTGSPLIGIFALLGHCPNTNKLSSQFLPLFRCILVVTKVFILEIPFTWIGYVCILTCCSHPLFESWRWHLRTYTAPGSPPLTPTFNISHPDVAQHLRRQRSSLEQWMTAACQSM